MVTPVGVRLGWAATTALAILLATTAATAQIPCAYEVTAVIQGPWCPVFGFPPTYGRGITEDGAVVGYYTSCLIGPSEAFYWSESTGFVTLDRPSGYTSAAARDIDSETGWIVGDLGTPGTDGPFAALWPAWSAQPIDLGTLPGGDYSQAFAVSAGRVVGKWGNEIMGPGIQAFLWQDNQMIGLGPDLGTPSGWAWNVNEAGQVCGWMGTATSLDARAFIWDAGRVTELPAIPGGFTSEGLAISADGSTVVGVGRIIDDKTGDDFSRAFVSQNGKMINLGTLRGFLRSGATDVNDNSLVIGLLWGGAPDTGFVWHQGVMIDLNTLIPAESGVAVTIPWAINKRGQITGQGHNQDGDVVALLLTPVEAAVADLDGDCAVGIIDLLILLSEWGQTDSSADLNDDGIVNVFDLLILLKNWG